MRNKFLCLVFFCFTAFEARAGFDYTPVLIHLNAAHQHDSIGFNLVEAIPQLIYKRLISGEISLWDSPKKEVKISLESLKAIERSTRTSFLESPDLFVNEIWKHYNRNFEFNIVGFTFINTNESGQKVVYGFIDAEEIRGLLQTLIIPTNANGTNNLTYWNALYSKAYPFNIVQFGRDNFEKNPARSFELKETYFNNPKWNSNQVALPASKELAFFILPNGFNQNNKILFEELNAYFNANRQDFFNLGGEDIISHLNTAKPISISKIEIVEIIYKVKGYNQNKLKQVLFYSDGKALSPMSAAQLDEITLVIDFKSIKEFLESQSYQFTLTKVNHQVVPGGFSSQYIEALNGNNWNRITELKVKN